MEKATGYSLHERLSIVQSELHVPKANTKPELKYSYRTAEEIMVAVKPLLLKYQLSLVLTDTVRSTPSNIVLSKYVNGKTEKEVFPKVYGAYVEATARLSCVIEPKDFIMVSACAGITLENKGMSDAQAYGSSSSYARKYALSGLFLLDDNKDPDDKEPEEIPKVKKTVPKQETSVDHPIMQYLQTLSDSKKEASKAAVKVALVSFGKARLNDLTKAQTEEILANLKEVNK